MAARDDPAKVHDGRQWGILSAAGSVRRRRRGRERTRGRAAAAGAWGGDKAGTALLRWLAGLVAGVKTRPGRPCGGGLCGDKAGTALLLG